MIDALSSWLVVLEGRGSNFESSTNSARSFSRRIRAASLHFSFIFLTTILTKGPFLRPFARCLLAPLATYRRRLLLETSLSLAAAATAAFWAPRMVLVLTGAGNSCALLSSLRLLLALLFEFGFAKKLNPVWCCSHWSRNLCGAETGASCRRQKGGSNRSTALIGLSKRLRAKQLN